jgi:CheY-like chemotaxis protein
VRCSAPESTVAGRQGAPAPIRPLKVLVVDDNADAANSTASLLEIYGHKTRVAYDGPSALQAVHEFTPEVVLLDLGLPVVDGFDVAKRLRGERAFGNPLLVALTGYGQEADRQRTLEAGFDYHLVKPVDFAEISTILAEAGEWESW